MFCFPAYDLDGTHEALVAVAPETARASEGEGLLVHKVLAHVALRTNVKRHLSLLKQGKPMSPKRGQDLQALQILVHACSALLR